MAALARALASGAVGAAAGALSLVTAYWIDPVVRIDFDTTPPRAIVSGVYQAERERATGLTFAWTQKDAALRLAGLDRSVDWMLDVRVRGARPDPADNPDLSFYADGVHLLTRGAPADFEDVRVIIPARADRRRRATISVQSSSTVVPGPHDARALGVLVDRVVLTPAGRVLPPPLALTGAAGVGAAVGSALTLAGMARVPVLGALVVVCAAVASLVGRGAGVYTDYPAVAMTAAVWVGGVFAIGVRLVERVSGGALANETRLAAALSAGALLLKLLIVLHPGMPIGDALFHAHRFQRVLGGDYYFTSIAPGNYLFPYAPGLYVFSIPFAGLVARGTADMALLRTIVLSADALAALALYAAAARGWGDRRSGVLAVAVYHVIPLEFGVVAVGNLTNVFAQSLSILALGMMASTRVRADRPIGGAVLTLLLAAAFMSHTSTFPLLLLSALLAALLFARRGGEELRGPARVLFLAALTACVLAIGLYYAHFIETYRAEFARIGGETTSAAPDAGGRGIAARLATVPYYLRTYFGWPAMLLALIGVWRLWRQGARDRLTLVAAGWALGCLVFLAVGILTPVDMRYYLAAIPVLALAAGMGASPLWSAGTWKRALAVVLLAWACQVGLLSAWRILLT